MESAHYTTVGDTANTNAASAAENDPLPGNTSENSAAYPWTDLAADYQLILPGSYDKQYKEIKTSRKIITPPSSSTSEKYEIGWIDTAQQMNGMQNGALDIYAKVWKLPRV